MDDKARIAELRRLLKEATDTLAAVRRVLATPGLTPATLRIRLAKALQGKDLEGDG